MDKKRVYNAIIMIFMIVGFAFVSAVIVKSKEPTYDQEYIAAEFTKMTLDYTIKPDNEVSKQITIEPITYIEKEPEPVEEETYYQAPVEQYQAPTDDVGDTIVRFSEADYYTASEFKYLGVLWYNGWRWTWYSERVLPGGGLTIPGRHLDEQGYVCDENDYICLASMNLEKGTVIDTPLGKQGKVYDYCETNGTVDVYVGW